MLDSFLFFFTYKKWSKVKKFKKLLPSLNNFKNKYFAYKQINYGKLES